MPNIREQRIDANGIYIVASDGRTFSLTREDAVAHFKSQTGTRAKKRTATIQWVKQSIETALGAEQVPMLLRRVPLKANPLAGKMKANPLAGLPGEPEMIPEPEMVPDHENAYDEDGIELDFDDLQGFKHLGMRS